jgi:formylglycine-generating enzyme required for sulfatase activity
VDIHNLSEARSSAATPPLAVAPFDAATAKAHQAAWAKHLGVPVEITNSIGMKFMLIPPGEFDMGSSEADVAKLLEQAKTTKQPEWYNTLLRAEAPKHRVRITKPFWLGRHEVTRGQFRRFVEDRDYRTEGERDGKGGFGFVNGQWKQDPRVTWNWTGGLGSEQVDDHPVVNVTWNDVTAFCAWLSQKEGETWHLPTEAQWEYACRAGTTTAWYSGDNEQALKEDGWFVANAGHKTHPVGQKSPNAWGLYDMHGNVLEWCQDCYVDRYYATSPMADPTGASGGSCRVYRGGGVGGGASYGRASFRYGDGPGLRTYDLGFRLARRVSSSSASR